MTKIKDNIYLDECGEAGSGTASIEGQQTSLALEEPIGIRKSWIHGFADTRDVIA